MRWLGEFLFEHGITILGVRLSGHATTPACLERTRWQDWLASLEDGFHLLRDSCTKIFVCGLSLGGALSLYAASYLPFNGVISISAPYELPPDWRLNFIRLFRHIQPQVPKGSPDWRNPQAALDHLEYPYYPTSSIAELRDLLAELRQALPQIKLPALIVHSRADRGVLPSNAEKIFTALGSSAKEILWVENSGHVVVREPDRHLVFERALQFIHCFTDSQ